MKDFMALDQYGQTYHSLGSRPRKELLSRLGRSRAQKMFRDKKSGATVQTGYVIAGLWLSLFEVKPFEKPA